MRSGNLLGLSWAASVVLCALLLGSCGDAPAPAPNDSGASPDASGACSTDQDCVGRCDGDPECKCMFPIGACNGPGMCLGPPDGCQLNDPWCGCNGLTYDTYCHLYEAGVSPRSKGSCP